MPDKLLFSKEKKDPIVPLKDDNHDTKPGFIDEINKDIFKGEPLAKIEGSVSWQHLLSHMLY